MNEKVRAFLKHPATLPSVIGVVSLGSGYLCGYFHGRRNGSVTVIQQEENASHNDPGQLELDFTKAVYEKEAEKYITESKEDITDKVLVTERPVNEIFPPVIIPKEEYEKMTSDEVDVEPMLVTETAPSPVRHTVFADTLPDWNYEEELAKRNPREPYIIHADEFFENENDYTQITITYYAGDDIMVDDKDVLIYNYLSVTGPLLFGHGSGDPNVLYVQSDKHKAQYEVLHHSGHYSIEVLGNEFEDEADAEVEEIRHSRRFREE